MRLTLRTLLAYMDDILDPADQEELGRKLETSAFATELIHRSRDAVRRLRLSAPDPLAGSDGELHGGDSHEDANLMSEYLDNTLSPDDVAEFERHCLEAGDGADMMLAEAASCHHVLTMVLGEPAEVDADMRQRMYRLLGEHGAAASSPAVHMAPVIDGQQLRIEPAHAAAPQGVPAGGRAATAPVVAKPSHAAAAHEKQVPDYLLVAARSRRRARMAGIAVVAALCGGLVTWFVLTPEARLPDDVAQGGMGDVDKITQAPTVGDDKTADKTAGAASESSLVESKPGIGPGDATSDAPAFNPGVPAATLGSDETAGAATAPSVEEPAATPAPPVEAAAAAAAGGTAADLAATPPAAPPAEVGAPAMTPAASATPAVPSPPPTDATAAVPAGAPNGAAPAPAGASPESPDATAAARASVTGAVGPAGGNAGTIAVEPQPAAPPIADATGSALVGPGAAGDATAAGAIPPDVAVVGPATPPPVAGDPTAPPPAAAPQLQQLGAYLGLGNDDLLLRYDENSESWLRLSPRSALTYGDKLAALPTLRTPIVLGGANVYLAGGSIAEISPPSAEGPGGRAEFAMNIPEGRVIINSDLDGTRVEIRAGDVARVIELSPSSSLAVDVQRTFVPGADLQRDTAPLAIEWHLTSGKGAWGGGADATTVEAPATWSTADGADQPPRDDANPPEWIDHEPATALEQRAGQAVVQALLPGQPVNVRLLELADPKGLGRRREVRSLAAKSGALIGLFDPAVSALADVDQRASWNEDVETLRAALVRDPAAADGIRATFAAQRGDAAADDLMELLRGFDEKAVGKTKEEVRSGALVRLIRWLDSDDLAYRVLASYDINEITGTSNLGGYRPEQTAAQRSRATERYYWPRLESGELGPK